METFNINLNIHYSAFQEVPEKLHSIYAGMPYWKGYEKDGYAQWYGGDGKLITASPQPGGLQFYARLPREEWEVWISLFKKNATGLLGYEIGEPEEGFEIPPFDKKKSSLKNTDKRFVKIVVLSVLGTILVLGSFVALCIINAKIGVPLYILFLAVIFALGFVKANKTDRTDKRSIKAAAAFKEQYGEEEDFGWDGYAIAAGKADLDEAVGIISNEGIKDCALLEIDLKEEPDEIIDSFNEALFKLGYGFYYHGADLEGFVKTVNDLCSRLNYDVRISRKDILSDDNVFVKRRRTDKINTYMHDINVLTRLLEKEGYTVIELGKYHNNGPYYIVPVCKTETFKKRLG